jgi:hypothetical protein
MNSQIALPIDTKTFLELAAFLKENNDPRDPVEVANQAIWYWMESASWKPELLKETDARGYQWKNLFLPAGTQIRMQYKGSYFYAMIDGDEMIYESESTSPASFANKVTQSSRNAWRDIWVKRPQDTEWKLANDLRDLSSKSDKLLAELD